MFYDSLNNFGQVSDEAKDLIRGLLNINSVRRLTVQQALEHPWFNKPMVSLGGGESVDSNDENETEEGEAESVEEEEEAQRSLSVAPSVQSIPEESELQEEAGSSRDISSASSRRGSQG